MSVPLPSVDRSGMAASCNSQFLRALRRVVPRDAFLAGPAQAAGLLRVSPR